MNKLKNFILSQSDEVNINIIDSVAKDSGGSNDFSTCTLTVTIDETNTTPYDIVINNIVELVADNYLYIHSIKTTDMGESRSFTLLLYQGKTAIESNDEVIKSVSGNIEKVLINTDPAYKITGDCEIVVYSPESI